MKKTIALTIAILGIAATPAQAWKHTGMHVPHLHIHMPRHHSSHSVRIRHTSSSSSGVSHSGSSSTGTVHCTTSNATGVSTCS